MILNKNFRISRRRSLMMLNLDKFISSDHRYLWHLDNFIDDLYFSKNDLKTFWYFTRILPTAVEKRCVCCFLGCCPWHAWPWWAFLVTYGKQAACSIFHHHSSTCVYTVVLHHYIGTHCPNTPVYIVPICQDIFIPIDCWYNQSFHCANTPICIFHQYAICLLSLIHIWRCRRRLRCRSRWSPYH